MAPQKSPAFQFYAKDFQTGTATMSLQEVGAYIRLLAHQWDSGSVPAEPKERARILGCAKAQEVSLWKVVCKKFALVDGVYVNERLEDERKKQAEYRRRQSDKGKASAAARTLTTIVTPVGTPVQPSTEPEGQPKLNSSSSSSSSEKDHNTQTTRTRGQGNGANAPGSLPRDHRFHAVCGPRLRICLTDATAAKLADKWGGPPDEAMPPLREFCDSLELKIGDGAKGDFLWLTQHFEEFMALKDRVPVAAVKPVKANGAGVAAQIDAWGRE